MALGLDQYDTPMALAHELVALSGIGFRVRSVVDPACGSGHLLRAASEAWSCSDIRGLDIDSRLIRRVSKAQPHWSLAVGSVYPALSVPSRWVKLGRPDALLLNPPFSMEKRRFVQFRCGTEVLRCSYAMAFLCSAVEFFRPKRGVLAIMPESCFYSELDARMRERLGKSLGLVSAKELHSDAFDGARARSHMCAWVAIGEGKNWMGFAQEGMNSGVGGPGEGGSAIGIRRGNLAVFRADESSSGVRFVHSTDLRHLGRVGALPLPRVRPLGSGQVLGSVVLLPRVGNPTREQVVALYLQEAVQLSDCVIGLQAGSLRDARLLRKRLLDKWGEFVCLYRGTGARFVTVARLQNWLHSSGILSGLPKRRLQTDGFPSR